MRYGSLDAFLDRKAAGLAQGPGRHRPGRGRGRGRHHPAPPSGRGLSRGACCLRPTASRSRPSWRPRSTASTMTSMPKTRWSTAVNLLIAAAPGPGCTTATTPNTCSIPFCETRSIRELLAFHAEERRDAMLTYVIDLYAADLDRYPDAVSLEDAHARPVGLLRAGPQGPGEPQPSEGTAARFLRRPALAVRGACPLGPPPDRPHRAVPRQAGAGAARRTSPSTTTNTTPTPAPGTTTSRPRVCSFRTAKALRTNPGSRVRHPQLSLAQFRPVRLALASS